MFSNLHLKVIWNQYSIFLLLAARLPPSNSGDRIGACSRTWTLLNDKFGETEKES